MKKNVAQSIPDLLQLAFTINIPTHLFHLKSMKLDIFCKYLIIGGVHLYLGYKGIATDSGLLQSNSCLYDSNKR